MGADSEYVYVESPSTGDVVRNETARQVVLLVFGVLGTVVTIYVRNQMDDKDRLRYWKMLIAWHGKHWADRQADRLDRLALWFGNVYNGEKL